MALGFLGWANRHRIQRVEYVSQIAEPSATTWRPRLIVPEHNNASFEWLSQVRQMLAENQARVRRIDYENAPFGRDVFAASPYRWWLATIAWADSRLTGHSPGQSLERAATVADPLIHLLLLVATGVFVAWRFGRTSAAFLLVAAATLFPLTTEFLPAMPDDHGLARALGLWSMLLLLAGVYRRSEVMSPGSQSTGAAVVATNERTAARWFFAAGVTGGLAIWVNLVLAVPLLSGIAFGALLSAVASRSVPVTARVSMPWRLWGLGGALTVLAAYLVEYSPNHLGDWQLRAIHPLYGLAWVGGVELLQRATGWLEGQRRKYNWTDWAMTGFAVLLVAALPFAMWKKQSLGFLELDLPAARLSRLPGGAVAKNFFAWLVTDGLSGQVWATVLPLALLMPATWCLFRRDTPAGVRASFGLAVGTAIFAVGFAVRQLSWWNGVDVALLALIAVGAGTWYVRSSRSYRWLGMAAFAAVLIPSVVQILPKGGVLADTPLNEAEVYGLVERELARWLALHGEATGEVVLAPHNLSTSFHYFAGLRGLPTLGWENREGLSATVRIASASTPEEAKELIDRRSIKYLVLPSWDPYMDIYAKMGMGRMEGTFLNNLNNWKLPPWLRPVAYQLPLIKGFEGQSLRILEVVEDQEDVTALTRTAEYFVEMGQLNEAAAVAQALRRFPADFGAWVARAEVELARGDTVAFDRSLEQLKGKTKLTGRAGALLWERRVALAVVLARGKQMELAREQVRRCLAEADQTQLRELTTGSLYRLLVLSRAFNLTLPDPKLRDFALELLPEEMRARL